MKISGAKTKSQNQKAMAEMQSEGRSRYNQKTENTSTKSASKKGLTIYHCLI